MSLQVFGCPSCQQPFQVGPEHAGQVVQCPSCAQTVEVPADAFASQSPAAPQPAADPLVIQCPLCSGQFGVTAENDGQTVACPHCTGTVQIQLSPMAPNPEPEPEPQLQVEIDTSKKPIKRKKVKKKSVKSKSGSDAEAKDLFAPGFNPKPQPAGQDVKSKEADEPPHSELTQKKTSAFPEPPKPGPKKPPATDDNSESPNKKTIEVKRRVPATSYDVTREMTEPPPELPTKPEPPGKKRWQGTSEYSTKEVHPEVASVAKKEEDLEPVETAFQPQPIDHLLPPKFEVLDPLNFRPSNKEHKVLLPDGKGGMSQLDKRVLHVEHDGQQVSLVALTPAQKKRRRMIQNMIAIIFAIIVMAIAFSLLSQ